MKDFVEYQGSSSIMGSRDATRETFQRDLVNDGQEWMEMIKSRNMTSCTYEEEIADEISEKVSDSYFSLFKQLHDKMQDMSN